MELYTSLWHKGLESLSMWKDKRIKEPTEFRHSQNPSERHKGTGVMDMADRMHHGATNLTTFQPATLKGWPGDEAKNSAKLRTP